MGTLLWSLVFQEQRRGGEPPTAVIRRVVHECWIGNPEYMPIISEIFPRPNSELLKRAVVDGAVEIADGTIAFVGCRDEGATRGAWIFSPKLASVRRALGAREESVTARLIRRLRPAALRSRGKIVATIGPAIEAPFLAFDSRRGRRRREFK
jgi:hypothetical protein